MASNWIWGNSKRQIVLLDTSAIFMVFENTIDLEKELNRLLGSYEIFIIHNVIEEINILKEKGSGKQKKLSKVALQFIKRYKIIEGVKHKGVDESLIQIALEKKALVLTNDKELRKRLRNNNIQTIFLRSNNYLMMD